MAKKLKPPAPPVTASDVARRLGIAQSTVSRAFNPRASVAPRMRAKILGAANTLGYQPNAIARSLITRRSNIVGIVMANLTNPFYPEVLEQFSKRLQLAQLQTLLFNVPPGKDVDDVLPLLRQYQVDAVIVTSATVSSATARQWVAQRRPLVLFNRYRSEDDVAAVCCDNELGARTIADYLAGLGHRRIAFVAGRPDTSTNLDRERGFTERLSELGIALHARVAGGDFTYDAGRYAVREFGRNLPDAVFFANDIMALGGMDGLRYDRGCSIPDDISVVGFDDIPMAGWPSYNLTTIQQPVAEMIDLTVDLLEQERTGVRLARGRRFIPGHLIERGSTRARRR